MPDDEESSSGHKLPGADKLDHFTKSLTARAEKLEESKKLGPLVVATKRFFEIEGLDLGGLLALELFTTIIPLVILGFSKASHFSTSVSLGDEIIKWLDLTGETADQVRGLFSTGDALKSTWTFLGLAGFLFWGIPMAAQVAKTWARAFRRERFPFWTEVWRGFAWFMVLLLTQWITIEMMAYRHAHGRSFFLWLATAVPSFILWSITPIILIRHGRAGLKALMWCGLVGTVIDLFIGRLSLKIVLPMLLSGWSGFGPIGAAMAFMTMCTVLAAMWVATAVLGAVLWERNAPPDEVVAVQTAVPE